MTASYVADRMPPLALEQMDEAQQAAAAELIAGPRKAVKGPFIPLLRSPALLAHVQKLGAYLRFDTVLPPRVSEFATAASAMRATSLRSALRRARRDRADRAGGLLRDGLDGAQRGAHAAGDRRRRGAAAAGVNCRRAVHP